jgi:hypothetical protein
MLVVLIVKIEGSIRQASSGRLIPSRDREPCPVKPFVPVIMIVETALVPDGILSEGGIAVTTTVGGLGVTVTGMISEWDSDPLPAETVTVKLPIGP